MYPIKTILVCETAEYLALNYIISCIGNFEMTH